MFLLHSRQVAVVPNLQSANSEKSLQLGGNSVCYHADCVRIDKLGRRFLSPSFFPMGLQGKLGQRNAVSRFPEVAHESP